MLLLLFDNKNNGKEAWEYIEGKSGRVNGGRLKMVKKYKRRSKRKYRTETVLEVRDTDLKGRRLPIILPNLSEKQKLFIIQT